MSKRGYVYHDHPRPFCGEGCPAYGESPLIQRYREGSAMSEPRTAADHRRFIPDDMKPNDAYILGQRDRYRRDREPDIKCRNCGQPWAIEAEAAAPTSGSCGCKPYSPCDRHQAESDARLIPEPEGLDVDWPDPNALATALYRDYDYTVTPDDIRDAYACLMREASGSEGAGSPEGRQP